MHHGVELEAVEQVVGAHGGHAAVLHVERLEPQVGLERVGQVLDAAVADAAVRVDGDASYAEHAVEVGSAVAQAVLPRLVVALERLHLDQIGQHAGALVRQQARREVHAVQVARALYLLADHFSFFIQHSFIVF